MSRSLFAELKRRNVIRAAILYAGAVWAFGQVLSQFSPALGLPDWATRRFNACDDGRHARLPAGFRQHTSSKEEGKCASHPCCT